MYLLDLSCQLLSQLLTPYTTPKQRRTAAHASALPPRRRDIGLARRAVLPGYSRTACECLRCRLSSVECRVSSDVRHPVAKTKLCRTPKTRGQADTDALQCRRRNPARFGSLHGQRGALSRVVPLAGPGLIREGFGALAGQNDLPSRRVASPAASDSRRLLGNTNGAGCCYYRLAQRTNRYAVKCPLH